MEGGYVKELDIQINVILCCVSNLNLNFNYTQFNNNKDGNMLYDQLTQYEHDIIIASLSLILMDSDQNRLIR